MATPDYATWLTKQQAATALGVGTKTIEQWAKDRKLDQGRYKRPGGGPALAVYNPDDVARLAADRQPEAAPFVLPAVTTPANGNGRHTHSSTALATTQPGAGGPEAARSFLEAMLTAILSQSAESSQSSQKSAETPWVDVPTAAAILGRSRAYVQRLIKAGTLQAERDRCLVVRRRDLEQL